MWQFLHWLSFCCGRLTWFSPVAKLTLSWQAPQASRVGFVSQRFFWVAFSFPFSWHHWQLFGPEGMPTKEKSLIAVWLRISLYGLPAITLGRLDPMWILWIITFMSMLLSVSGFVFGTPVVPMLYLGVWQRTQTSKPTRDPPCEVIAKWHLLQDSTSNTSRTFVTAPPFGTKV